MQTFPSVADDDGALIPLSPDVAMTAPKLFDSFVPDFVGAKNVVAPTHPLLIGIDTVAGDRNTTATLTVDGPHVVSTIDTPGDQDFFKVELVAGQYYDIGQYLKVGGPNLAPLADAYIELYDSAGNLIVAADGGGPNTPQGLDALLTYQATYTGTYYVNARSFDNALPDPTTTGDYVGDYEVFVKSVDPNDVNVYIPRYSPDQPMHSIDWGSQFDRTSRNPDGDNGPRDNGAPFTGMTYNAEFDITGKNVITYYFAKTGDVFVDENPATPGSTDTMIAKGLQDWEKDAFRAAFHEYEKVADLVYIEVDSREAADIDIITYPGTPGVGASLLGRMSPPNEENEGQTEFNAGDVRWTQDGLKQGGFYFPTLLHEFGHGHGMAHPHDNGGRSSVMPGGDGGTAGLGGGYGDFNLSQQVFTVMSYNDGWSLSPYGQPRSGGITGTEVDNFGWQGTLAALDIAVIQDKYGVNEEWATGNDVYTIKDVNEIGTFYATIWDAGGNDEIRYSGARDARIDLRAATLKYEIGGGGWVSYADGIYGGFTIANGVTIEKAVGGAGNDVLVGNDANNSLGGGAGADWLEGWAGNDWISAGIGDDRLDGGLGADALDGQGGVDTMYGGVGDDVYWIDNAADDPRENAGEGNDTAFTSVSTTIRANVETLILTGDASINAFGDGAGNVLVGNAGANVIAGYDGLDWIEGGAGHDWLEGGASDDRVDGGAGNDRVDGGVGADVLIGGSGFDTFVYASSSDSSTASFDSIRDFESGIDVLNLSAVRTGAADSYSTVGAYGNTYLFVDLGGDGVNDMLIELQGVTNLQQSDVFWGA